MVKNFRQFVNESTLTEKVDMAELEYTLKRVKKENPGKKVGYIFIQDAPKGYKISIDGKYVNESNEPVNEGAITKAIRPSLEGEVKAAVEALEKELQSTGAILDYKHVDRLAYCVIDIIDAAKQEERAEYAD